MRIGIPFRLKASSERNRLGFSGFSSSGDRDDGVFCVCGSQSSYAFFSFRKAWDYLQKG